MAVLSALCLPGFPSVNKGDMFALCCPVARCMFVCALPLKARRIVQTLLRLQTLSHLTARGSCTTDLCIVFLAVDRGGFDCGSAIVRSTGRTGCTSFKEAPSAELEPTGK